MEFSPAEIIEQSSKINIATGALKITDQKGLDDGAYIITTIAGLKAEINNTFDPIIQKQHSAHKEAVAQKKKHMQPIIDAESRIKGLMASFMAEQERIRADEEAKARERVRKEQEKLEKKAEKLRDEGKDERAEIIQNKADSAPIPTVAPTYVKPKGVAFKKTWKARVINEKLVPRAYLVVSQQALDKQAKATENTLPVPGVEFYCESSVARTGR